MLTLSATTKVGVNQLTSEKEPVNLRESFEEESSYELIQVLSCKKKKKRVLKSIHMELQEPGCWHGKKAAV